ncbi:MSHA biogenesis protein MshK [Vibrio natriegens]|uniref:MSHA biogenesis protein MshK n=1 Tax=Vibrio natriegens TaxID=691 RepID=UPI003B5C7894
MVKKFIISIALTVIAGGVWADQDPTAPLGWQKPVAESNAKSTKKQSRLPTLNSIVCKVGSQCSAILDNQIVEQGELFKGYRVVSITSEFVTLKQSNRQWKLELFGLNVKK